jgi:hypothetical protein
MSDRDYRWFNLAVLLIAGALIGAIAGVNIVVDPYAMWRRPLRQGFNDKKPMRADLDRLRAARDILVGDPETLVLGKSNARQYSVDHIKELTGGSAANAAMVMAGIDEARDYMVLASRSGSRLRRVVVVVDMFEFGKRMASSSRKVKRPWARSLVLEEQLSTTLSEAAVRASSTTLRASSETTGSAVVAHRSQVFERNLGTLLQDNSTYLPFTFAQQPFDDLREMVETARADNIELVVVVNPIHTRLLEGLTARGAGDDYRSWLRRLVAITPVWDFSGYNEVTTESVSDAMRCCLSNSRVTRYSRVQNASIPAG